MKIFDDGKSEEIFTGVNKILQTVEQEISRTNTESEIAKINNHAGLSAVKVSKSTFELISTAVNYARDTNGKFNPAIGPLVNLWGIGHEGVKKP
ncbi:Thiamine biosynthesis lipoprotein ApbE precursor [compost metagenome]